MRNEARRSWHHAALIFVVMLLGCTMAKAQQSDILKPVELDSSNGKSEVAVSIGQNIIIKMAASTRNDGRWSIKNVENDSLHVVSTEQMRDKQNQMLAYSIVTLKAMKAGKTSATLSLSYQSNSAEGRRIVGNNTFKFNVLTRQAYQKLGPQGVKGSVIKITGSHMPGPGIGIGKGASAPISVPVYIFKGEVKVFQKPDPKHKQLVKIVQSEKDGKFQLDLPPGRYTAVAVINGKMYLNSFNGANTWSTFSVFKGKHTDVTIKDTSEAAF